MNLQSTQTILPNNGQPLFMSFKEIFESVKEQFDPFYSYQTTVSQEILAIERPLFGTGAAALSVPQVDMEYLRQLNLLQKWYVFRNEWTDILRIFESYPFLVSLLVEAYSNIKEFFPYSLVYLMATTDAEEFGIERLIAFIATDLALDTALDTLSAFDKKWWLKSLRRAEGKLCIALEFQ